MKQKQAHLKTIAVLVFLAIMSLLAYYFPLTLATIFLICASVGFYMAIYTLFKD
jgi:heme O synthase-like polyprenyltransferase